VVSAELARAAKEDEQCGESSKHHDVPGFLRESGTPCGRPSAMRIK
jgi:hypothetical protein